MVWRVVNLSFLNASWLQRAGYEGWGRPAPSLLRRDLGDAESGRLQIGRNPGGLFAVGYRYPAPLALHRAEARLEGYRFAAGVCPCKQSLYRPVLLGHERAYLMLPVDYQPQRDGLNTSSRQTPADLLPENGAKFVPDQPVEDPPGLLRVDQPQVDAAGVVERGLDRRRGDLVEDHGAHLRLGDLRRLYQVPRDGLAFPVRVGARE